MTKERNPAHLSASLARSYASHPLVRRTSLRLRFATFARVLPQHHVLDVATGPGYNAFAFARRAATVIGVDERSELLALAEKEARRRGLTNVRLTEAGPSSLPFPDNSFHLVTSAAAIHHARSPEEMLAEMARVCRPGGSVAIEDIVASEQEMRARYHNRLERLRDRAHYRCLPLSELIAVLGRQGLRVRKVQVEESWREFNEWIAVTHTPVRRAEHIRRLLQGAADRDLTGLNVQPVDDTFLFAQQVAWVLAVKPAE